MKLRKQRVETPLRRLRRERGLTQREAATMFDVDQATWSRFETGQKAPRGELKRRIEAAFRSDLDVATAALDALTSELATSGLAQEQLPLPEAPPPVARMRAPLRDLDQIEREWDAVVSGLYASAYEPNHAIYAVGFAAAVIPDLIRAVREAREETV